MGDKRGDENGVGELEKLEGEEEADDKDYRRSVEADVE